MLRFTALLALVLLLAPAPARGEAAPSAAQAEESWSGELVDGLMSPYCPGRTLRSCPSDKAGELIAWIEGQEAGGRGRNEVYEELLANFGDEIRQRPDATGFGAAAYVIPVLAFLSGGLLVAIFLRRQGAGAGPVPLPAAPPVAADPELERLVDEELGRSS